MKTKTIKNKRRCGPPHFSGVLDYSTAAVTGSVFVKDLIVIPSPRSLLLELRPLINAAYQNLMIKLPFTYSVLLSGVKRC